MPPPIIAWRGMGTDRLVTQATAESIVLNPKYHDILAVAKAARNGAVYGTKVRFPHALVYDAKHTLRLMGSPADG